LERKAHNSLNEAALQVQLNEALNLKGIKGIWKDTGNLVRDLIRNPGMKAPKKGDANFQPLFKKKEKVKKIQKDHVEYDEVDSMVLEYFENYFGDNLNEDTSDEDIMQAVYDLVELRDAVCDVVQLDEKKSRIFHRGSKDWPTTAKDYHSPENFRFNPPRKPDIFGDRPRKPTPLGGPFNRRAKGQRIGKFIDKYIMRKPEHLTDTDLRQQQSSTKRHQDAWKARQKSNAADPNVDIYTKAVKSGAPIPKFPSK
jgi:hypothetical protein